MRGQWRRMDVRDFSTFSAKALAGIGKLPDTTASRSIPMVLKRRASHEHVEKFRFKTAREQASPILTALETWATTEVDALRKAEPDVPDQLGDRAANV